MAYELASSEKAYQDSYDFFILVILDLLLIHHKLHLIHIIKKKKKKIASLIHIITLPVVLNNIT